MSFPVSEKWLIKTEEELEIRFPNDYRQWIMQNNGGSILGQDEEIWNIFPIYDATDQRQIKRTAAFNIVYENKQARQDTNFPTQAIAIASNDDGDYLLFLKATDSLTLKPALYLWRVGEEGDEVASVSTGFVDFIKSIPPR